MSGGVRRGSGYAGIFQVGVSLDLEKLTGLTGSALVASGFWASGRNVSEIYVGNELDVQETYAPGDVYLGQLSVAQSLFEDTLTLEAGRLFAGDVFMTSPLWDYSLNGGINDNLNSILANVFFPEFQTTAWGARITAQPTPEIEFVAGVYDANPNVGNPRQRGTDFSFRASYGALTLAQGSYRWEQGRTAAGLPGSVSFGGYYESSLFTHLDDASRQSRGSYGLYLYFDQMLFRGAWPEHLGKAYARADASRAARAGQPYEIQSAIPKDRATGLTAWGAAYIAPQQNLAPQHLELAAGLLWHGLLPGREHDVAGVAALAGMFSNRLPGQGTETVLEVSYRVQLTPWLYLTPDFQYVIHPSGFAGIGDAAVLAGEVGITF